MAHVIENLVEQTSTSRGAATLTLSGTPRAPLRRFADVMADSDTTEVMVVNNDRRDEWQAAEYRYAAGVLTFVRLIRSPTGSPISFGGGLKRIAMVALAERVAAAAGNDLPCGPFGSWRRSFAQGTDDARRVQGPEGATIASEDFEDNASLQQYAWPGAYGARVQLSGNGAKKTNVVLGLTPTQCSHMRGTWRTLAFQALHGAGASAALLKAEIIGSREPYQPIIRADGYYTSESEVIATTQNTLAAAPSNFSASGLVPSEIMQVAARFEIDWNGSSSGATTWVAILGVWMGEGRVAMRPPADAAPEVAGARYYRSTYPAGMSPGSNPMLSGALPGTARQNGLTSGGNPTYGAPFRLDADMIVVPTAICHSPATGADGMARNIDTEADVTATLLNVSTSGVSALVRQGSNNVADLAELSLHITLESKV